jgi:hypothetical protein
MTIIHLFCESATRHRISYMPAMAGIIDAASRPWPAKESSMSDTKTRLKRLKLADALRAADARDYGPLLAFVRS